MKRLLLHASFFLALLIDHQAMAQGYFLRIVSDQPDNIHCNLGSSAFFSGKMPTSVSFNYGIELDYKKLLSLELRHAFASVDKGYTGFYLLGTDKKDYQYGEFRIGLLFHLLERDKERDIPIALADQPLWYNYAQKYVGTIKVRARRSLALRLGYDMLKGRAAFDTGDQPLQAHSLYAGFSWTVNQAYRAWAAQFGKPHASRKYQFSLDLLWMPDDGQIIRYNGDAAKVGFRAAVIARSTHLDYQMEAGVKPGLRGNYYFTVGVGGKISWRFRPFQSPVTPAP